MASTFTKKNLRFTFTLSNNATFAGTNSNVLTISGLRATADMKGTGFPAFSEATLSIWGMKKDDMIALTAIQLAPLGLQRNTVQVEADSGQGFTTVFMGDILTAGPDWDNMPDVPLNVFCRVDAFASLQPAPASSYTGPTSVDTIVSALAAKLGKAYFNNGVSVTLDSPYFSGTIAEQLRTVQAHAGISIYNDPTSNIVEICPSGVPRNLPSFTLSPDSGLVGQPKLDYQRGFVNVRAYFNPAFRFGGPLTIAGSVVPTANGNWQITTVNNSLSSLMPSGPWFSDMFLVPPGELPALS